jgi:protein phosphatase
MLPATQSDLILAHGTHPGETGKNNEDSYGLAFFRSEEGEPVTLAIVADGVGGNRAGEVASDLAVQIVIKTLEESTGRDYGAMLELAVVHAAHEIADRSRSDAGLQGMATTCAVALVAGRRLYTAYVGDSRLYLIHNETIRQTSVDHTWVQEAIEAGVLTREEARHSQNKRVLRRSLGKDPNVKPDFRLRLYDSESHEQAERNQGFQLEPGDIVLICSDGLTEVVEPEEIFSALGGHELQAAVDEMIALARSRGGPDNITVVVLKVPR